MPDPIPDPLWSLMLSTNGCHPGCGCGSDRFEMTPFPVARWAEAAKPGEPAAALRQVQALIGGTIAGTLGREDLIRQAGVFFRDDAAVAEWLRTWERLLDGLRRAGPDAAGQARGRNDLAERFARKEQSR